jgi:2'-5' RNA ligase
MKNKRLFIGFSLNKILTTKINDFKDNFIKKRGYIPEYKWVKPENYHLTLLFVGSVSEKEIPSICDISEKIFAETKSFDLEPTNFTSFPHRKPKMIWLRFENSEVFKKLVFDLRESILKSYNTGQAIPHVTLARIKRMSINDQSWEMEGKCDLFCDTAHLYESELKPEGSIYSIIKSFRLMQP